MEVDEYHKHMKGHIVESQNGPDYDEGGGHGDQQSQEAENQNIEAKYGKDSDITDATDKNIEIGEDYQEQVYKHTGENTPPQKAELQNEEQMYGQPCGNTPPQESEQQNQEQVYERSHGYTPPQESEQQNQEQVHERSHGYTPPQESEQQNQEQVYERSHGYTPPQESEPQNSQKFSESPIHGQQIGESSVSNIGRQYSGYSNVNAEIHLVPESSLSGSNLAVTASTTEDSKPTARTAQIRESTPVSQTTTSTTKENLKERLSRIPARLPRLPLLGALRSGPYAVSESKAKSYAGAGNKMADDVEESKITDNGDILDASNQEVPLTRMDQSERVMTSQLSACKKKHSVHRSALTKLLCGLYALLLVVFGIVFAVANALTGKERQHLYYLEVFLIYLYIGSLIILLYFQICILRGVKVRNNYFDSNIRVVIRRSQDNIHLTPSPTRKQDSEHQQIIVDGEETYDCRKEPLDQLSTLSNRSHLVVPADGGVAHVGEGINFYLRLGALAFSVGSVTLDGFHIASYFETESTTTCESYIFPVVYALHLIFTFIQTFFLFKNHKLVIDKNKASVRFGLMHLLATNLTIWFVTAITETAEDYRQQDYLISHNESLTEESDIKSCYEDTTLARTASPYLFPCTIIYSIIAAGILYRMYQYVGVKVTQHWPSHTSLTSSVPHGAVSMDCEKANKGLFTGLLVAVVTLIAIATFFVFESRLNYPYTAIKIFFVMEISLIIITGSCIVLGMFRFVQLKFLENYLSLDAVLLIISLGGAYIYLSFMLISSASMVEEYGVISIFSLVVICVGILESTLQAIFILDGLCRHAENDAQVESKPGRAVVTFLLVCNLALWVVSMFEIKKTMVVPFHLQFYGILPWNIILHLCVPLFVYFRFHSAICLSKIWYHAYQKDRNPS